MTEPARESRVVDGYDCNRLVELLAGRGVFVSPDEIEYVDVGGIGFTGGDGVLVLPRWIEEAKVDTSAVVAPTWPGYISDECGTFWLRLDQASDAQRVAETFEAGKGAKAVRIGREVLVRDPDLYAEDGLLVAEPGVEHDDAAVYVRFEVDDTAVTW